MLARPIRSCRWLYHYRRAFMAGTARRFACLPDERFVAAARTWLPAPHSDPRSVRSENAEMDHANDIHRSRFARLLGRPSLWVVQRGGGAHEFANSRSI